MATTTTTGGTKPVEFVVPAGTGGGADQMARFLQGVVAKHKFGPYVEDREQSSWVKILNRNYSQKVGREELFERDRQEPTPGWHRCVAACGK